MQEDLVGLLEEIIRAGVRAHAGETRFREPLLGFADADDHDFLRLNQRSPGHLLPADLLPGARTVISFFLPFAPAVVEANRAATPCAREWAVGYTETNRLIARLSSEVQEALRERGHRAVWELPTHEFDRTTLRARWSHKSVARIAGLGEFGLHRMLITPSGCAGRFGSVVTDAVLRAPRLWRGQACLPPGRQPMPHLRGAVPRRRPEPVGLQPREVSPAPRAGGRPLVGDPRGSPRRMR